MASLISNMAKLYSRTLTIIVFSALNAAISIAESEDLPWVLSAANVPNPTNIRILVIHDMEGLAGQSDPRTFRYGSQQYATGQELLVADVNAVVAGLFAGGADVVDVVDGHGSGNPEPDILLDKLDPRAHHIFRPQPFNPYTELAVKGAYDGVAVVGMHAKSGSKGFASHTYTIGVELLIGDRSVTETELVAMSYGHVGAPVIFASGDDRLKMDLGTMPWLEYVVTKKAESAWSAVVKPVANVRKKMTSKASQAVRSIAKARVMKMKSPMQVTVKAVAPASLTLLNGVPSVNFSNNQVSFSVVNFPQYLTDVATVIRVLRASWSPQNYLMSNVDKARLNQGYIQSDIVWLNAESGVPLVLKQKAVVEAFGGAQ